MMRTRQQTGSREEATDPVSALGSRKAVLNKKGETNSSRSVNSDNDTVICADSSARDLEARIALRAHQLYEERGGCHGEDQADWFEAERQIWRQDEEPGVFNARDFMRKASC